MFYTLHSTDFFAWGHCIEWVLFEERIGICLFYQCILNDNKSHKSSGPSRTFQGNHTLCLTILSVALLLMWGFAAGVALVIRGRSGQAGNYLVTNHVASLISALARTLTQQRVMTNGWAIRQMTSLPPTRAPCSTHRPVRLMSDNGRDCRGSYHLVYCLRRLHRMSPLLWPASLSDGVARMWPDEFEHHHRMCECRSTNFRYSMYSCLTTWKSMEEGLRSESCYLFWFGSLTSLTYVTVTQGKLDTFLMDPVNFTWEKTTNSDKQIDTCGILEPEAISTYGRVNFDFKA